MTPVRLAVLPPVPVPYREPLFAGLAARDDITLRVIYQAPGAAGWDQRADWFPDRHAYDAVHLEARQRDRPGRTPIVWPRGIGRALSAFEPDVVVASEYGPGALAALAWARRHRRPHLVFSECTRHTDQALSRAQLAVHRFVAARAAGGIAVSSAARDRMLALGMAPGTVTVSLQSALLEPVHAATAAAASARAHRSEDDALRLLCVARLVPDKNVDGLLEALALSELAAEEAMLEIAGSGPLDAELRARAAQLGVPARFTGFVAPEELPAAYAAADAFVLPSRFEPFGVAVREARAAGLPIICSLVAGAAGDVAVDGRNALLVDPEDQPGMARALQRLVRDRALRERMAAESAALDADHPLEVDIDAFASAAVRAARAHGRA